MAAAEPATNNKAARGTDCNTEHCKKPINEEVKVYIKSSALRFLQNLNTKRKFSSFQTTSRTLQPHCNRQFLEVRNSRQP